MKFHLKPRVFIVILACLFTVLNGAAAATLPSGGKLLYTTQNTNNNNIVYVLNDDGGLQLAADGEFVWGTGWSPDGTTILLNRQIEGKGQIYKANADGSSPVQLTSGSGHYYNPVWSPTGENIAYAEDAAARQTPRLMLMSPDGSNQRVLYRGMAFFNTWSPDGTQVIITVEGKPVILDLATRKAVALRIQGFEDRPIMVSDWSRDGQWIAFTHLAPGMQQIHIASIDGTTVRRVVDDPASHHTLKWSADASRFVFISTRDAETGEVYSANADGSNVQRLTFSESSAQITTLAYWTLSTTPVVSAPSVSTVNGAPVRKLFETAVNPQDPASVAQKVMTLLVDGKLEAESGFVCPEMLPFYLDIAQASDAAFSDLDLSSTVVTVVNQTSTTAQIQLSGTMSVLAGDTRVDFPAALFPVATNPVTLLHLIYDGGWKVCTPV